MASTASGTAFQHLRDLFGPGTAAGLTDEQVLDRFSGSNDAVAFEALVARHGPMVLATCRAVLKSEHDVEDAFQTTFLLCDLEGLTYDQAADRLRWTVPTLRCRLAKARHRLKGRLTRRGFAAPTLGAVVAAKGARTAVPPVLMRSTVLAATSGSASSGVVLLTHALLKEMLMTKIKFATTVALAALGLASAGVIAAGGRWADDATPPMKPTTGAAGVSREKPVPEKPLETVEITGRVVAPNGRPVTGATVTAVYIDADAVPWPKTISGSDGRFSIRLPKPERDASAEGYLANHPWLVASAPGYGVGWCDERGLRADRPAEQVVTLVEEGPPIEGRIVDLEGRPVVGASVRAAWIWYDEKGNIAGWIAKARNGAAGNLWQGLSANTPGSRRATDRTLISTSTAATKSSHCRVGGSSPFAISWTGTVPPPDTRRSRAMTPSNNSSIRCLKRFFPAPTPLSPRWLSTRRPNRCRSTSRATPASR
jgi:hypothetical protein